MPRATLSTISAAKSLLVPTQPAIIPYKDASIAASVPSARRAPNSITPTPFGVASIIRLAPVACSIAPLTSDNTAVSII